MKKEYFFLMALLFLNVTFVMGCCSWDAKKIMHNDLTIHGKVIEYSNYMEKTGSFESMKVKVYRPPISIERVIRLYK